MAEVYEKSKDYPAGVVPFNKAVIPAANILTINGKWIGFVQSIEPIQARDVTEQYEVGSIGPVDMLPGQPSYSLKLTKTKIYLHNAMQIFMEQGYQAKGYEVKDAIKGQMVGDDANKEAEVFSLIIHNILPFDIEVWELNYGVDAEGKPLDFNLDPSSKNKIVEKYVNCWITNYTKPITQGTVNEVESIDLKAQKLKFEQG